MNKPVAWIKQGRLGFPVLEFDVPFRYESYAIQNPPIPLYTHPAKELHLSLQKDKETGELLAVTYTDDEHRIVEVLWEKPPAKELTDEEIMNVWCSTNDYDSQSEEALNFAKAILRKAQEQ